MKLLSTVAAATALTLVGFGASAATYDFGALADGVGEGEWGSQANNNNVAGGSYVDGTYTVDGIGVSASGYVYVIDDGGFVDHYVAFDAEFDESSAYLDGSSGGDEGGLGVCSSGYDGDGECTASDDDNVGPSGGLGGGSESVYEFVTLTFDTAVTFTDFLFRGDDHQELESGTIAISFDDPTAGGLLRFLVVDIAGLAGLIDAHDWFSETWSFAALNDSACEGINGLYDKYQQDKTANCVNFYIDGATVNPIPLPAAGWLLIAGLGGLAAMRRRKS